MPKCSLTQQKVEQRDFRHAVLSKPYKPVLWSAILRPVLFLGERSLHGGARKPRRREWKKTGLTTGLFPYFLEDWMKRSFCLLQVLRYRSFVKETSGSCYKSIKSSDIMSSSAAQPRRSPAKKSASTARHSSPRMPPTSAGRWGKSSMKRFSTPPQAPKAGSRAP